MQQSRKHIAALLMLAIVLVIATACGGGSKVQNGASQGSGSTATPQPTEAPTPTPTPEPTATPVPAPTGAVLESSDKHPIVTIELSNDKIIKVELFPEVAPNTVNNFISLVQSGFYDGVIFHRVIPGFMIQGGDPDGTGMGGPGYSIAGEFTSNNFENNLLHTRGIISMARSGMPDSAGSQFFIMVEDAPHLDEQYAAFGFVTEGLDAVDEIVNQPRNSSDRPNDPISMRKVTVDTKGMTFEEPVKVQ